MIRHSAPMHALGILRAQLLVALLARGHSVFVSDVDTVWLRDPTHFFGSHPSCVGVDAALGNDCISAEPRQLDARGVIVDANKISYNAAVRE